MTVSRRRAFLALASWPLTPPAVVYLVRIGAYAGALVLSLLFVVYVAVEVFLYERRDHAAAALHRRHVHAMAGPLTGYCPQTDDRYFEQVESRRWMA